MWTALRERQHRLSREQGLFYIAAHQISCCFHNRDDYNEQNCFSVAGDYRLNFRQTQQGDSHYKNNFNFFFIQSQIRHLKWGIMFSNNNLWYIIRRPFPATSKLTLYLLNLHCSIVLVFFFNKITLITCY